MFGRILTSIITLLLGVTVVSVTWSRFTNSKRPAALQHIYDSVTSTENGKKIASVLGASANESSPSAGIGEAISSIVRDMGLGVVKRVEQSISQQAVSQVSQQYEKLPQEQKAILQEVVCKPMKQ